MDYNIAIIGSGPSALYTVQSILKISEKIRIDVFEKLPSPYGLIRYGVAPDHQKTKNIIRVFRKTLLKENVNFYGNVNIGKDLNIKDLQMCYDSIILATGASRDKNISIPGSCLGNVIGSSSFVGWYNGHPDFYDISPNLNGDTAVL